MMSLDNMFEIGKWAVAGLAGGLFIGSIYNIYKGEKGLKEKDSIGKNKDRNGEGYQI